MVKYLLGTVFNFSKGTSFLLFQPGNPTGKEWNGDLGGTKDLFMAEPVITIKLKNTCQMVKLFKCWSTELNLKVRTDNR